jgi:4-aminobutyrate aminotransferase / (S)-3-amino-2-methylpropionate transaminase / 5-aminovalerate transaminase
VIPSQSRSRSKGGALVGRAFDLTAQPVPGVETPFRRIVTPIPAPESVDLLETMRRHEPASMLGQPPVVWDRAEGVQVHDRYGNMWLDWSSGVLVTNAGHGAKEVRDAILATVERGLLHTFCFPNAERIELARALAEVAPPELGKVFLLTTGSETIECAVKLMRTYGQRVGGKRKIGIVSFEGDFHGRTLGAQLVGGIPALKEWIVNLDPDMHQVPFPDGFRVTDTSFEVFLRALEAKGVGPDRVAGIVMESFQGGSAAFAPKAYVQAMTRWCREHNILLAFDEVQAGFGRSGRFFAFEHYDVVPDLICCGKGISSSLPLSAVIGRPGLLDLYGPADLTNTHGGNPVCCAAALASLKKIRTGGLTENARETGAVLHRGLAEIAARHRDVIGAVMGRGLVAGLHMVVRGSTLPDGDLAFAVAEKAVQKGLLMFAPVGVGGATVKICPPLTITREAVQDGLTALGEAIAEAAADAECR